jgi:hypothetical protein
MGASLDGNRPQTGSAAGHTYFDWRNILSSGFSKLLHTSYRQMSARNCRRRVPKYCGFNTVIDHFLD